MKRVNLSSLSIHLPSAQTASSGACATIYVIENVNPPLMCKMLCFKGFSKFALTLSSDFWFSHESYLFWASTIPPTSAFVMTWGLAVIDVAPWLGSSDSCMEAGSTLMSFVPFSSSAVLTSRFLAFDFWSAVACTTISLNVVVRSVCTAATAGNSKVIFERWLPLCHRHGHNEVGIARHSGQDSICHNVMPLKSVIGPKAREEQ